MASASPTEDTPLMQQWREVKSRHRDALVFFRVGDFYELFFGDAEEGARLLGLTLTSRNNGAAARVPLAGIPVKALDEYLARLVKLGRRVAICEQVEDPALAKGIVKREVVETVTPGTIIQENLLHAKKNNHLVSLVRGREEGWGLASMDLSTGEMEALSLDGSDVAGELGRLEPSELLVASSLSSELRTAFPGTLGGFPVTTRDDWVFDEKLTAEVPATGDTKAFKTAKPGQLKITKPGTYQLPLRPVRKEWKPIRLRSVRLTPATDGN